MAGDLRLRAEQLETLDGARQHEVNGRAELEALAIVEAHWLDHLRERGPDLVALVRELLARARSHGLLELQHQVAFVNASMALGPGFEDDSSEPWARDLLEGELPPELKVARLREDVRLAISRRMGGR